ncbi:Nucleoside transporter family protein [Klebsormidium nitens]|uniref:Nucleoside transporter family protein n=1 Tax=Klebsormidium nitens TaxID=105231 RepID=A0A0U9HHK0_KLENI|nr:Nucleoside transporter family protein [Klebsormidium nitens]|eukprot:GAQ77565.1 Nucleoside transporter family protein [Klebsormidium nitens]
MRRAGQSPRSGPEQEVVDRVAILHPKMTLELLNHDKPPDDKYNVAYIIFFAMGAGFLFPWNSFITAADYFGSLYPEAHIERSFSLAYMLPTLVSIVLLIKYGRHYAPASRITLGFAVFLLLLLIVPLIDIAVIRNGTGTPATLAITIGLVMVVGTMDAVVQGSLFGVAGELPEKFTQALSGGTGASGLLVSLLRCFTKAALPNTRRGMRASALLYFAISAVFIAGVLAAYRLLKKLPIIRYYERLKREREAEPETVVREEGSVAGPASIHEQSNGHNPQRYQRLEPAAGESSEGRPEESQGPVLVREPTLSAFLVSEILSPSPVVVELDPPQAPVKFVQVFRKIWVFAVMLLLIYEVTLSIFPGFLAEDVHSAALGDWYPVLLITAYNLGDLAGKMAPLVFVLRNDTVIVASVLLRVLFFPAFFVCVWGPAAMRSEWIVFSLTLALGVTNGYFTSVLMMLAPKRVDPHEAETAGTIMVLFLVTGLAAGAISGWLWLL